MARFDVLMAAAALAGTAAAPAAAQYPQQPYPQTYPQQTYPQQGYPQQGYPDPYQQQGYGYQNQPYGTAQNPLGAIVDSLIGNHYNVSDRQAIHRCANAAVQRAQYQNPYPGGGYGQGYAQAYPGYANSIQVTAITEVQRRTSTVRVRGTLGHHWQGNQAYGYGGYGNGYQNNYRPGDLNFRCDVDYQGYVRDVRLEPVYRGY